MAGRKKSVGRPRADGMDQEKDYEVFAHLQENSRWRVRSVCTVPAMSKTDATAMGQNFCTALGYDFSHVNLEKGARVQLC